MRTADPATLINRQLISADTVEEAQIGHDWWHTPFGWTVVCEQQELWNAPGSIQWARPNPLATNSMHEWTVIEIVVDG